jgi:hypothetical protein
LIGTQAQQGHDCQHDTTKNEANTIPGGRFTCTGQLNKQSWAWWMVAQIDNHVANMGNHIYL